MEETADGRRVRRRIAFQTRVFLASEGFHAARAERRRAGARGNKRKSGYGSLWGLPETPHARGYQKESP
jgi:hypothetical protein